MTTDERLDSLAERHQALAESLQIAQHQHADEMQDLREAMQDLREAMQDLREANRRTETSLRRAIELSTREARAERERRRAAIGHLDGLMAKLAAAQLATEEKLQRFLEK